MPYSFPLQTPKEKTKKLLLLTLPIIFLSFYLPPERLFLRPKLSHGLPLTSCYLARVVPTVLRQMDYRDRTREEVSNLLKIMIFYGRRSQGSGAFIGKRVQSIYGSDKELFFFVRKSV